jgi:hypothetical protein
MKNISNIEINKKQLENYLMEFHPSKIYFYNSMFVEDDFTVGKFVFIRLMKSKINMPKIGKSSINYWIARGWDEYEAELKRTKPIVGNKSPMRIEYWVSKGFSIEEANKKIKSQRKTNLEYWTSRGFSVEESNLKIKEFQSENSFKRGVKYREDEKFRNIIKSKQPTNIEYWLSSGFSIEEAKNKLSERQHTFSLEKCVSKYGKEQGLIVWRNRQEKWLQSLYKSNYNGKDGKDSKSIDYFKKNYGDNWVEKFIDCQSIKNKEFVKFLLKFKNYMDLIDYLINKKYSFGDIFLKIHNRLIPEFYNIEYIDLHKYLISKFPFYKKGNSIDYYIHKYGEDWPSKFIEETSFKDKNEIYDMLKFNTYTQLVDFLVSKNLSITEITLKIQNKIIQTYYNCTIEDMLNYLMSLSIYIKSKYGNMRYFNNHLCRSDSEFIIARFLVENNIEYKYEKKYPNSNYKCDFFIPILDCYVEYMGMFNNIEYKNKYKRKKTLCVSGNLKHIYSSSVEEIKNYLKNEIENIT